MEADKAKGNSAKTGPARELKLSARGAIGEDAKSTSTWAILKDLHMSIIDGGVSILKGLSRLTGTAQGISSTKETTQQPGSKGTSSNSESAVGPIENTTGVAAAPPPAVGVNDSEDELAAIGTDWIDTLLEDLDTSELFANRTPVGEPGAATSGMQGSRPPQPDDQKSSFNTATDLVSNEDTVEHPGF